MAGGRAYMNTCICIHGGTGPSATPQHKYPMSRLYHVLDNHLSSIIYATPSKDE